jgi:hypothetical protein
MTHHLKFLILILPALFTGCYTGSNFTLEASHLDQPVSFSPTIHTGEFQVIGPGDYEELGHFSISFSEWSVGSPINPNNSTDISKLLNEIVKQKGGNGVTRLTIKVENSPVNFVSMMLRGFSYVGLVVGGAMLAGDTNKTSGAAVTGVSLAGILLFPTAAHFTVEGTVVNLDKKKN